jgi:hypothetical protein
MHIQTLCTRSGGEKWCALSRCLTASHAVTKEDVSISGRPLVMQVRQRVRGRRSQVHVARKRPATCPRNNHHPLPPPKTSAEHMHALRGVSGPKTVCVAPPRQPVRRVCTACACASMQARGEAQPKVQGNVSHAVGEDHCTHGEEEQVACRHKTDASRPGKGGWGGVRVVVDGARMKNVSGFYLTWFKQTDGCD